MEALSVVSEASTGTYLWVLLGYNLWWPVDVSPQRTEPNGHEDNAAFEQKHSKITRTKLRIQQTDTRKNKEIWADLLECKVVPISGEIHRELCTQQSIHPAIQEDFYDCITATFAKHAKMEISVPEPTQDAMVSTTKRRDVVSWDDYFMAVAFLSSLRSKDPSTQVGACIVNADNRIVGIGYNGFPRGCSDDVLPWARSAEDPLDTKYPYVCHAEMNAILNKNSADVNKCKIFVALFPCNECAKMIIQSGISEVVYLSDKHHETTSMRASRRLLTMANVQIRKFIPKQNRIVVDYSSISL